VKFTPEPWNELRFAINKNLGGLQSRSGCFWRRNISLTDKTPFSVSAVSCCCYKNYTGRVVLVSLWSILTHYST
jgi:hypothetical protein